MTYEEFFSDMKDYYRINNMIKKIVREEGQFVAEEEDICQNIWLKLTEKRPEFEDEAQAISWISKTAKNIIKDMHRSTENRMNGNSLEYFDELSEDYIEESFTFYAEQRVMYENNLKAIEPNLRKVLRLKYEMNCTVEEICKITGQTIAVVKSQIMTAKRIYRTIAKVA